MGPRFESGSWLQKGGAALSPVRRTGGAVITIILCLLCLGIGFAAGYLVRRWEASGSSAMPARCLRVVDTDTIVIHWLYGTNKVRMAGIDAPEKKENKKLREQAEMLKIKPAALLQISQVVIRQMDIMLTGKDVKIVFPRGKVEYDSFGRVLAYIEVGGKDICEMLIRNGLVYPRPEPHPRKERYAQVNAEAKAQRKGIYGLSAAK
ncbi:MAG: thermonuclease family protein [Kiritimatiellae bacterium]|nr:thermonuclease family protein [Kiritimatiellia bacterium]